MICGRQIYTELALYYLFRIWHQVVMILGTVHKDIIEDQSHPGQGCGVEVQSPRVPEVLVESWSNGKVIIIIFNRELIPGPPELLWPLAHFYAPPFLAQNFNDSRSYDKTSEAKIAIWTFLNPKECSTLGYDTGNTSSFTGCCQWRG